MQADNLSRGVEGPLGSFFAFLDGLLGSANYFPLLVVGAGIFFTLYLGFPQVRYLSHAWAVLRGRYTRREAPGDASHFESLSTALGGLVGTGNIGSVALALYLGGPAALFWMSAAAFVGMATKLAEVTLAHAYRTKDDRGEIAGGPMYYMDQGLKMKWLAIFFAVATVVNAFGGGLPQSNDLAVALQTSFDVPAHVSGLVFAALLGLIMAGGIRRISLVAATVVPIMILLYVSAALAVLITNHDRIIPAFVVIFQTAFTGSAAAGGFLGASFAYAFNRGVNRSLVSNEAGQGTSPIIHAMAKTDEPVAEGIVSMLGPFIDTLVISTLTGLVILSSGAWGEKFPQELANTSTEVVQGTYSEESSDDVKKLFRHFQVPPPDDDPVISYSGALKFEKGLLATAGVRVLHNRSIADNVSASTAAGQPYDGKIRVVDGRIEPGELTLRGDSMLHSVPLAQEAFNRSFLGLFGQYIVTICLVLFGFSTAIVWSYYGDRAITYLLGTRAVIPYRLVYIAGFFVATIADTSLVWLIASVTVALGMLPNLLALVLMRKELKSRTDDYGARLRS